MRRILITAILFYFGFSYHIDTFTNINSKIGSACFFESTGSLKDHVDDTSGGNIQLKLEAGPVKWLKWSYGPVSLGMVMDMSLVSLSGPGSEDLLFSRIWQGLFVYPAKSFTAVSLKELPVPSGKAGVLMFAASDFDNNGIPDLIAADREGFLYLLPLRGKFPEINYDKSGITMLRDALTGFPFNIPQENPNFPKQNDLGGYTDIQYFNYTYPEIYSTSYHKFKDLIIGDGFGNLWWLPDISDGKGLPSYTGVKYTKEISNHKTGIQYQKDLGLEYSKPAEKICDENGTPFLLGTGKENERLFNGANTRPVLYPDEKGIPGLLVLSGTNDQQIFYLKRINPPGVRKPVFRNTGEVTISGLDRKQLNFHSKLCLFANNARNDLLLSSGNYLAILTHSGWNEGVPEFTFSGWISDHDVPASGYLYNEILAGREGKRYIIDFAHYYWKLIPIENDGESIKLRYTDPLKIMDQNGIFGVPGETDPQFSPEWGYHRIAKWDFNGSRRQNLITATDKGNLYLLIDDPELKHSGDFVFRSAGPLRDSTGNIIRIHNRAVAGSIDVNGDGREDLLVGGISYQMGIISDPNPGGGIYCLINIGIDATGTPVLAPPYQMEAGEDFKPRINSHIGLQILDLDHDNIKEIIISLQEPEWGGRIFHLSDDGKKLIYSGKRIPMEPIIEQVLDIDGDSYFDIVRPGDESGVGFYKQLR
jgi:hypothetical protein